MGHDLVNQYMNHTGLSEFLKENESFDVCVIEIFNADALLVCKKFKYSNNFTLNGYICRESLKNMDVLLSVIQHLVP